MSNTLSNDDMIEAINKLLVQQIQLNAEQFKPHAEGAKFDAEAGKLAADRRPAHESACFAAVLMLSSLGVGAALAKLLA